MCIGVFLFGNIVDRVPYTLEYLMSENDECSETNDSVVSDCFKNVNLSARTLHSV